MFSRTISRAVRVSFPPYFTAGSRKGPNATVLKALFSNNRFLVGNDSNEQTDLVKIVKEGGLNIPVSNACPEVKQYVKEWRARNPEFVKEWKSKLLRHFNRDMELLEIQEKQQKVMDMVEKRTQEKLDAVNYLEEKILGNAELKAQLDAKLSDIEVLYKETLQKAEEDPVLDAQLKANPEWVSDLNDSLYAFLEERLLEDPELHAKWIAYKQDIPELHAEMKALDKSYRETEISVVEGHKDIFLELTDMMQRYEKVQEEWKQKEKEMETPQLVDELRHELMLQLLIEGKPAI